MRRPGRVAFRRKAYDTLQGKRKRKKGKKKEEGLDLTRGADPGVLLPQHMVGDYSSSCGCWDQFGKIWGRLAVWDVGYLGCARV